ncbi:MAG: two pore domain potassium channel family protein [Rhizobiaceae bacterium]|nr:two pore domain potassium channel family protein [Rhizobiaceae bacterium]
MTYLMQIFWGSVVLGTCSLVHLVILVWSVDLVKRLNDLTQKHRNSLRWGIMFGLAFGMVVLAHTIQVWIWASSFMYLGVFTELADAIYFSLVTYTTVGYGDVTAGDGFRIYAAMAAVTGLLNFGLSTAFLVGLFSKLMPDYS